MSAHFRVRPRCINMPAEQPVAMPSAAEAALLGAVWFRLGLLPGLIPPSTSSKWCAMVHHPPPTVCRRLRDGLLPGPAVQAEGVMFRLTRNMLSGSYIFLISVRRSKLVPYVACIRCSSSSAVWKLM